MLDQRELKFNQFNKVRLKALGSSYYYNASQKKASLGCVSIKSENSSIAAA